MKARLMAVAGLVSGFVMLVGPVLAQDAKSIALQGNQKWIKAHDAGDAATLTTLYSKDAVLLPQGVAEPLIGQASIRKYFDEDVKHRIVSMALPVAEARMLSPNTLFAAGRWSADVPNENGASTTHVSGTYLTVWTREGSDWRIQADTWNMTLPPSSEK